MTKQQTGDQVSHSQIPASWRNKSWIPIRRLALRVFLQVPPMSPNLPPRLIARFLVSTPPDQASNSRQYLLPHALRVCRETVSSNRLRPILYGILGSRSIRIHISRLYTIRTAIINLHPRHHHLRIRIHPIIRHQPIFPLAGHRETQRVFHVLVTRTRLCLPKVVIAARECSHQAIPNRPCLQIPARQCVCFLNQSRA
jgi:hypothetical protein